MNKRKLDKREINKKDKEWRQKVLKLYDSKCVICGDTNRPNAHHIIPRTFKELRWDVNNSILLCVSHHKFGKFSAHKNALWFIHWLRDTYPLKYNYLINKLEEIENGYK